ncbi:MAG: methyltransferase domain-containing protein [Pontiellaceae bacterium]|jgi:malonyl-CoA O-methyltransferase|nr:methyltransferase domain-containing protein [Pontiellaceae bacterium]
MIEKRFSAAAETYDRHARPQLSLARSVCDVLPEIYPEQILELGSGTGQLTRLLTDQFPDVLIDAVDLSGKMVEYGRNKLKRFEQITWIQGDAQTYRGTDPYPLIVSSATLHWVSDLRKTFDNIFQNLEPGGFFALGMMIRGTLKELLAVRSEIAPEKTPPSALHTLDELIDHLHAAGFKVLRKKLSEEEVSYKDTTDFLRTIHEQGVTGSKVASGRAPLNRSELNRLIELYQERYTSPDGVYATYEAATLLVTKE